MSMLPPTLTESDLWMLAQSWIPPELANAAELRRVSSVEGSQLVGRNGSGDYAGIVIPYRWPGANDTREYRLRRDHPELESRPDGTMREKGRYLSPPGRGNMLYFAPGTPAAALTDTSLPVVICEGEKKVLALSRLSEYGAQLLPIGLPGVWNWRGTLGIEAGPDGGRRAVKGPIADLARIAWQGRTTYIIFDSDKQRNTSIQAAERQLARELKSRGSIIRIVDIPDLPGLEKTGTDDFLAHQEGGPERLLELINRAPDFEPGGIILDPSDPLPSARRFVDIFHTSLNGITLRHQAGVFYKHEDSAYHKVDEASIRAQIYSWLENAQAYQVKKHASKKPELAPFKPTIPKVANVMDALRAVRDLPTSFAAPCWLENDPGLDPFEILACKTGLLHLPIRRLIPATPQFFTLNALEFGYDPNAPRPTNWLSFLQKLWAEDEESISVLQEFLGYLLTPKTHLQKMLLLIGPKRAGKGTIGRVIRKLLGDRNICAPTLTSMKEQFGLSVLIGKTAAIIADARISGRADTAVITEHLLSISGEDPQTIPRKHLDDWNGMLSTRFAIMTNELPKIEDASGTLASRFIVLALTKSFYGHEDHNLLDRLIPELPGILLWALDGWDRLHRRGRLIQPQSSSELISQFEDLGSPIGAFVRERCEIGPGYQVQQEILFAAWKSWCEETGRDHSGTIQIFGRNLHSFVPWLSVARPRVMGIQTRYYVGIRLKGDLRLDETR